MTAPTQRGSLAPSARLAGVSAYARAVPAEGIFLRLDANEGVASRSALEWLSAIGEEDLRRYPDASVLEGRIAAELGIDASRVVVTNGADDAIDRVCRALLDVGTELLTHEPSFEMIARSARLAGASVRGVRWIEGGFPCEDMLLSLSDSVRLVAIVSPNNPTGSSVEVGSIRRVADGAMERGAAVLVDLAYAEFAALDPMAELLDHPGVIVVRTMSKAKGLAGLRVGYAVAPSAEVATWLRAAGGPYPVSSVSLALAGRRLADKGEEARGVMAVRAEREDLTALLWSLGGRPLPSEANFVTVFLRDAGFVSRVLGALGISVRSFGSGSLLAGALRLSLPGDPVGYGALERGLRSALAPEALLFDLDGVIADVSRSYRSAIVATARSFGVTVEPSDVAAAKRRGDANNDWVLTHRLLAERGVRSDLAEVTARFQAVYLGTAGEAGWRAREVPLVSREWLEGLAERYALGIVTGRPRAEAAWFLDTFDLSGMFRTVVAMEDGPAKPAPDVVQRALRDLGVGTAWMVGDTPDDVRAAIGAGVVPIGVVAPGEAGAGARESLLQAGAVTVLSETADLLEVLP